MTNVCNLIFVYGTLLKGEERSHYLRDCKLISAMEILGSLYDTGNGYPAAVFNDASDSKIAGELYLMPDPGSKLKELDLIEQVESGLFERVLLSSGGKELFTYQAGEALKEKIENDNIISDGSWRMLSSLAASDPVSYALNFEEHQRKAYKERSCSTSEDQIYISGNLPLIVTAPHATAHVRLGKLKRQEFYTGAVSSMLHNMTGCHVLYTNCLTEADPNYYDDSAFKEKLTEIAQEAPVKFLLDLHGTGPGRSEEIFPGTGREREFLLGKGDYFQTLLRSAESSNIKIGGEDVFPAARQMTVTKYGALELGVPSMQIEIVRELRKPDTSPKEFKKLLSFLKGFITQLSLS